MLTCYKAVLTKMVDVDHYPAHFLMVKTRHTHTREVCSKRLLQFAEHKLLQSHRSRCHVNFCLAWP